MFLTDLDSRAAIKGSRDPLGLVPVWSRFGRTVVGNLTTVSNSVRGFTTTLLGYYFAERVAEGDVGASTLDLFLKFEQLAGYSRYQHRNDRSFRGTERVGARLAKSTTVTLGAAPRHQILGDQKTYGLWGLFSVPSRDSGMLADRKLTPEVRSFVEREYIRPLIAAKRADRMISDLLRRDTSEVYLTGRHREMTEVLATILSRGITLAEKTFYSSHLVDGGHDDSTKGRQRQLSSLLSELPAETPFDIDQLTQVINRASTRSQMLDLSQMLQRIRFLEALLVPMENAFWFLLSRDGKEISVVASEIKTAWGKSLRHVNVNAITGMKQDLAKAFQNDSDAAQRFVLLADTLHTGDFERTLHLLLEHNAYVMRLRSGSDAWARLDGKKVDVRYKDESGALIRREELPMRWRNTYFINALKDTVRQLGLAQHG